MTNFILFITVLGLIWYSYETRKVRISSEKQVKLSLTPFVVLKLEENEAAGYCFKLRNEGVGLALYIKIAENNVVCRNSLYPGQDEILRPRQKGEKDLDNKRCWDYLNYI